MAEEKKILKVLVACEFSGIVREAFRSLGHDAWSCDLLPTEIPGNHIQDSIFHVLSASPGYDFPIFWDLIIGHPPCDFLSNSGVCHLYINKHKSEGNNLERWGQMKDATIFFNSLLNSNCEHICIENPIQHKYARNYIKKYNQIIQPWMFGHPEQKATCLWLKGLPLLKKTNNVYDEMMKLPDNKRQKMFYLPPTKDRAKLRAKTFPGIAKAMAEQWSEYLINKLF